MSAFNLHDNTTMATLAASGRRTSTVTGSAVDVRDYIGKGTIAQLSGAAEAGSSPTLNGKIEDSADGSTDWQDVTGLTFAEVTDAALEEKIAIDFNAVRRHIRYVGTIGGTSTPTFDLACVLIGRKQIV